MYWIPIKELDNYRAYPTFLKEVLGKTDEGMIHIVTDERVG